MNKIQSRITKAILLITAIMLLLGCATPTECYGQSKLKSNTTILNWSMTIGYDVDVDVYDTHISINMQDARMQVLHHNVTLLIMDDSTRISMIHDLVQCVQGTEVNTAVYHKNFQNVVKRNGKVNKKQISFRNSALSNGFSVMTKKQALQLLEILKENKL